MPLQPPLTQVQPLTSENDACSGEEDDAGKHENLFSSTVLQIPSAGLSAFAGRMHEARDWVPTLQHSALFLSGGRSFPPPRPVPALLSDVPNLLAVDCTHVKYTGNNATDQFCESGNG